MNETEKESEMEEKDASEQTNTTEEVKSEAEEKSETETGGYVPQYADIAPASSDEVQQAVAVEPQKKKSFLMPTVIIAIAIILVAAIGAGIYLLFFNTSIVGAWTLPDTAEGSQPTYLVFESDGTAKMVVGSVQATGTYKISDASKSDTPLNIVIQGNINGDFGFKLEGNMFTTKTLTLSNSSLNSDVTLTSGTVPEDPIKAQPDNAMDDNLIGKWNIADYGISYTFQDDGIMYMQNSVTKIKANYSIADGKISMSYMADTEQKVDSSYEINGDILVLDGAMAFTRDGSDATIGNVIDTGDATAATEAATQTTTSAQSTTSAPATTTPAA